LKKAACIKQTALLKIFLFCFLFYSGQMSVSTQFFAYFRNTKQKPPDQFQSFIHALDNLNFHPCP